MANFKIHSQKSRSLSLENGFSYIIIPIRLKLEVNIRIIEIAIVGCVARIVEFERCLESTLQQRCD